MKLKYSTILIILFIFNYKLSAQNYTSIFYKQEEFNKIRQDRDDLYNQIVKLRIELNEKTLIKPYYSAWDTISYKGEITSIKNHIDIFENLVKNGKNEFNDSISFLKDRLNSINNNYLVIKSELNKYYHNKIEFDSLNNQIRNKQYELIETESKINKLLTPEVSRENFMKIISFIFAILIGLLIVYFFRVVSKDEKIRSSIFGSDSGIQFITLFSIVIAIILFGITGTLEGKELSALLGSVSGYILGRVTKSNSQETVSTPQPIKNSNIAEETKSQKID